MHERRTSNVPISENDSMFYSRSMIISPTITAFATLVYVK